MSAADEIYDAMEQVESALHEHGYTAPELMSPTLRKGLAVAQAQHAILKLAHEYGDLPSGKGSRFTQAALNLARAINEVYS